LALVYFGWEYFEAILVLLPLPDPFDVSNFFARCWASIGSKLRAPAKPGKDHPGTKMEGYTGNFDSQPVSMADGSDDDEEDIEDVGVNKAASKNLNYDSDEQVEEELTQMN